jgi:pyroglutamyl-peptidase
MTSVLVTGFESFGEHEVNPSQLIAEAFGGVVLPVSYERVADGLQRVIEERAPDRVVSFGLAVDRTAIGVERFAHNLDEAATTDNDGAPGSGRPIDPDGPLALGSTLPVDAIVAALNADGISAEISRDAGGYLCNHVFYCLRRAGANGGFVHLPLLEILPLDAQIRAARTILAVAEG